MTKFHSHADFWVYINRAIISLRGRGEVRVDNLDGILTTIVRLVEWEKMTPHFDIK